MDGEQDDAESKSERECLPVRFLPFRSLSIVPSSRGDGTPNIQGMSLPLR